MPSIFLKLFCLLLLLSVCKGKQQFIAIQEQLNQTQANQSEQIDPQRLQSINFVIKAYFPNCSMYSQSSVLYSCSIVREKYAEFLYALFHKEHIMNFLKLYQLQGKLKSENQIGQMYKIGEKVRQLVVTGYQDWIQIYKPNKEISVEQMYGDIPELDQQVLDIIEHDYYKHEDFVNVLKKISKISNEGRRYIVMGNKTEEEIAEDYEGILQVYFGNCRPITQCSIGIRAFVYFVKQLAFYITPLVDPQLDSIVVSQQMDFRATKFLIQQIQKIKSLLGLQVEYSELQQFSQGIAMSLFQYLKNTGSQEQKGNQEQNKEEAEL